MTKVNQLIGQNVYENLMQRMGLTADNQAARRIFEAGINVALHHQTQQPVLLQKETRAKKELSQADLQFISHVFNAILNQFNENLVVLGRATKDQYNKSNIDVPSTHNEFQLLNYYRDMQRDLKAKTLKMAKIQNKLKSQIRK